MDLFFSVRRLVGDWMAGTRSDLPLKFYPIPSKNAIISVDVLYMRN